MKKILCFGDSNTYGFIPRSGKRYDQNTRWTGVLQNLIGNEAKIIEAGCNNRTCFKQNSAGTEQTGISILHKYTTLDLDIIIIQIGLNDLQFNYKTTLEEFEKGLDNFIIQTKQLCPSSTIILLSPSHLSEALFDTIFSHMFNSVSIENSKKLLPIYTKIATKHNCKLVDLNSIAQVSQRDGLHYDAESHKNIALNIYKLIKSL